jgi:cytochrome c-type biogenesis protein CcmH
MDSVAVDWLPSLLVLSVALAVGVFLVWHFTRRGRPAAPVVPGPPVEERDLLAKRDALLAQLRELLDTASKRDSEQLARERYALELKTAGVLRDLDQPQATAQAEPAAADEAPAAQAEPAPAGNPALRGFLWATGSMALVGGLFYLVSQQATARPEGASVTGNTPSMAPAAGAVDPEEARAKAAVDKNPDDLEARLDLARVYLGRQDMMGVWNETQFVLARNPQHPQALSYQALVRLAMGQSDLALDMMKKALATAPDFLDGYVHIALVYVRTGKAKEAEAAIAEASRRFPDQKEMLQRVLAEMKAQTPAETGPPASGEANPHATVPAPGEPNPHAAIPAPGEPAPDDKAAAGPRGAAPAAPPDSGPTISGSIDLDPALRGQLPAGAVIYVMARPVGVAAGPPLAAVRLGASSFPVSFEIGSQNSMTGGALPEAVLLEARLDDDGDAATRTPNDPKAKLDGIKVGAKGVKLVLKRGQ